MMNSLLVSISKASGERCQIGDTLRFIIIFCFVFFSAISASACDLSVSKSVVPWQGQTAHANVCLDTYFEKRELLKISIGDDVPVLFEDPEDMVFDDILLVESGQQPPFDEVGRLAALDQIFTSYQKGLKNEYGTCELKLFSGANELSWSDFLVVPRELGGQPGTRRILTKDDVTQPGWKVLCPDAKGKMKLFKSGSYFFVFVDFYENKSFVQTKAHLVKFLFSFR